MDELKKLGIAENTLLIAMADNGPMSHNPPPGLGMTETIFRGGKGDFLEGGVRVPLFVRGPGIKPGVSREIASGLDFYPTLLAMTGAPGKPEQIAKFDGVNIYPYLLGKENEVKDASGKKRDILYWHFPFGRQDEFRSAMREGDFKLYKNYLTSDYSLFRLDDADGKRLAGYSAC